MRRIIVFMTVVLVVLAGCAPPQVLYLTPGRDMTPVDVSNSRAKLVLQKFSEDFGEDEVVGQHSIGSTAQLFKIEPGRVAGTLDLFLGDLLVEKGAPFRRGSGWDLTLDGLDGRGGPGGVVVGGRITRLSVKAETGFARLTTQLELAIEVECYIALTGEGKVVKKGVSLNEKILKVSADQRAIEKVLEKFLDGAAKQVVAGIEEFIL